MRPIGPRFLAAIAACVVALSCADVPTLADGIAFISPIQLPALSIAVNDTLRDSLGNVAPLRVFAFDQNDDTLRGVNPTFLVATVPAGVKIDANGIVTAFDSLRTVQVVGRIADHLQTAATNLEVVAQPDLIAGTGAIDSLQVNTASSPLQVTVTGNRNGTRVPVNGIVVHYRIVFPMLVDSIVFTEGVRPDLTKSVDTTTSTTPGVASRRMISIATQPLDSIIVEASANNLRGQPLTGSPVRFRIPVKKGTSSSP
jgi:hypothetical protein